MNLSNVSKAATMLQAAAASPAGKAVVEGIKFAAAKPASGMLNNLNNYAQKEITKFQSSPSQNLATESIKFAVAETASAMLNNLNDHVQEKLSKYQSAPSYNSEQSNKVSDRLHAEFNKSEVGSSS